MSQFHRYLRSPLNTPLKKSPRPSGPGRGRRAIDRSAVLTELRDKGLFDLDAARQLGLAPTTVDRLVAAGTLIRVGEKLFVHAESGLDPQAVEYAVACRLVGEKATVGGLSALRHYQLTDSGTAGPLWLLVPPEKKTRRPLYRLIRTTTTLDLEVVDEAPGYRLVTIERAIVEAFRYASKFGLETAFMAAATAFRERQVTAGNLLQVARTLGLERFILPQWEALLALETPRS